MIKMILLIFSFMLVLLCGCADKKKSVNRLYDQYLENYQNLSKQKELMLKTVSFIDPLEKENKKEAYYDSACLMITYLRLFIIAEKEGDIQGSEIYFQKARYWFIVNRERENLGKSNDLLYDNYLKFTPESRRKFIMGLDEANLRKR